MSWSRIAVAGVASLVLLAAVGTATAGTSTTPEPAALGLVASDVPGSTTLLRTSLTVQGMEVYVSVLAPRASGSVIENLVMIQSSAADAADVVTGLGLYARTAAGRLALGKAFAKEATSIASSSDARAKLHLSGKAAVSKVAVGKATTPSKGVLVLPFTATVSGHKLHLATAYVQVDRAIDVVEIIRPGSSVAAGALEPLIAAVRSHMRSGFTVANTGPPAIAGSAVAGQTLTADTGSWSGGAARFAYAWQRCAADGSACAAIAGATGSTYVVTTGDAGSTIRVAVTGSNTVSDAGAMSGQTPVVS